MSVRGTHVPEHLRLPIAGVTPPPTEKEGQRAQDDLLRALGLEEPCTT